MLATFCFVMVKRQTMSISETKLLTYFTMESAVTAEELRLVRRVRKGIFCISASELRDNRHCYYNYNC